MDSDRSKRKGRVPVLRRETYTAVLVTALIAVGTAACGRSTNQTASSPSGSPTASASASAVSIPPSPPAVHTAYVSDSADGGILIPIDLATNKAGTPISLSLVNMRVNDLAVTPDGQTAYVIGVRTTPSFTQVIVPVDLASRTVRPAIPLGLAPDDTVAAIALAPDGRTAYVAVGSPGLQTNNRAAIEPVNLLTGALGERISLPEASGAASIAIAPDGRSAYVAGGEAITPVNLITQQAGSPIILGLEGTGGIGFSPDGGTAYGYWTNPAGVGNLIPIDVAKNKAGAAISLPGAPNGPFVLSPSGATAYVLGDLSPIGSTTPAPVVIRVNLTARHVDRTIAVPTAANSIAIVPDGHALYLSGGRGGTAATITGEIIPIDLSTGTPASPISVPAGVQAGPGQIILVP